MSDHDCVFSAIRPDLMILGHSEYRILHLRCMTCLQAKVVQVKLVSEIVLPNEVSVIN